MTIRQKDSDMSRQSHSVSPVHAYSRFPSSTAGTSPSRTHAHAQSHRDYRYDSADMPRRDHDAAADADYMRDRSERAHEGSRRSGKGKHGIDERDREEQDRDHGYDNYRSSRTDPYARSHAQIARDQLQPHPRDSRGALHERDYMDSLYATRSRGDHDYYDRKYANEHEAYHRNGRDRRDEYADYGERDEKERRRHADRQDMVDWVSLLAE